MENTLINKEDIKTFLDEINSFQSFTFTKIKKSTILDLLALKIHSIIDSNNLTNRVLYLNEVCSLEVLNWFNQDNFGFFMTFENDKTILYEQKRVRNIDTLCNSFVYEPYLEINNHIIKHYDKNYKPLSSFVMYAQSHNYFFKKNLIEELTEMVLSYIDNGLDDYLLHELFIEKTLLKKEEPLSLEEKQFLLKRFDGDSMNLNNYLISLSKKHISNDIDFVVNSILKSDNQKNYLLFTNKSKLFNKIKNIVNNNIFLYLKSHTRAINLLKIENDFNIHSNIIKTIQEYEYSVAELSHILENHSGFKISFKYKKEDKIKSITIDSVFTSLHYSSLLKGPIIDYHICIPVILDSRGDYILLNGFKDDTILNTLKVGKLNSSGYSKCKEKVGDIINKINEIKNLGFEVTDCEYTFIQFNSI